MPAPTYRDHTVRARCPDCGVLTSFEPDHRGASFGAVVKEEPRRFGGVEYARAVFVLMKCASCGRGGLAKIHCDDSVERGVLGEFHPIVVDRAPLPDDLPTGIASEFLEAERCAAIAAWRGASALFRSTLEKVLRSNGYVTGSLRDRIDEAGAEGVITAALKRRAHDDIRVLGNDVLHDDWREVSSDEVDAAHHYAQRIIEAFNDERAEVEAILGQKGRLAPTAPATAQP
jgi:hypothetical protein